jgi:molybdate transport system ATP-binding protein
MRLELQLRLEREGFTLELVTALGRTVSGLFGPSGAGKTTLLQLVAGLLKPDRGRIALDGRVLFDAETGIDVPCYRRRVGVVFQDMRLFPHLSVRRNLAYGRKGQRREELLSLERVVELLELGALLERRPAQLSGGEQRRVALGRALLSSPRLLLLDEPLAGLDHKLKAQVLPFLRRVRDGLDIPMIYVTHELDELLQLTDHLLLVSDGRVLGSGLYHDLVQQPNLLPHLLPLGLLNVWEMVVGSGRPDEGVTRLVAAASSETGQPAFELKGPPVPLEPGRRVAVAARPEDIAIAAQRVDQISVQNQLPATVRRVTEHQGRAVLELDAGVPVLVSLTHSSLVRLGLKPGARVWWLLKSNALKLLSERPG